MGIQPRKCSMLYQLEGTNTKVFGSMHLVPPGAVGWIAPFSALAAWADEFAVEMRPEAALQVFSNPAGRSIALLPMDLQKRLRAIWPEHLGTFEHANLPGATLVASMVTLKTDPGVEPHLEKHVGDRRVIHELEDANTFLRGYGNVAASQFATALRLALNRSSDYRQRKLQEIYDRWLARDGVGLYGALMSDLPPTFVEATFTIRNRAMAQKIAVLATREPRLLICIGAGHVCGPNNVLDFIKSAHGIGSTEMR